jgi:hypothetical protein
MYLASLIGLLFTSNLLLLAAMPISHEVAVASGYMFAVWGLLMVFRSSAGGSLAQLPAAQLGLGALFLALAVGCRPSLALVSLLVPLLLLPVLKSLSPLWASLKDKGLRQALLKNTLALASPYLLIGAALMWYNYARFGSVMEFGTAYQLTTLNIGVATDIGLLGLIRRFFDSLLIFLFSGFGVSAKFPFIVRENAGGYFTDFIMVFGPMVGALALPLVWFLPIMYYLRKNGAARAWLPLGFGMVAVALIMMPIAPVSFATIVSRYTVDFLWFLIIPANLCAGSFYAAVANEEPATAAAIGRLHLAAVILSCIILLNWGLVREEDLFTMQNPVIFRYISDMVYFF